MARLVDTDGTPVALGIVMSAVAIGAGTAAGTQWLVDRYGDDVADWAEESASDFVDWVGGGVKDGFSSLWDSMFGGSSPNRFKCKAPSGDRKHWICVDSEAEELISCPQGFRPERTRILEPQPKKRITNNYDLSIGGRMCIQIGMPNEHGMGPCDYDTKHNGKKVVHRNNERTGIFHPSPRRRLVHKSRNGRACVKVIKPTRGPIPDYPHMKSRERAAFEASLARRLGQS